MTRPRLVIVGAGMCGSVLAARLREAFDVTVVEQGSKPRPLLDDIRCDGGGVTTTINRGAGLGGTTSYWHNALIELAADELRDAGIDPVAFAPLYRRAWGLFLTSAEIARCQAIRTANAPDIPGLGSAHMVVPQSRDNLWALSQRTWPGRAIDIVHGRAQRIEIVGGRATGVMVQREGAVERLPADYCIVAAGGLATPPLLAASIDGGERLAGGYHDHPMAYVAKLRLRPDSALKQVSCVDTGRFSVRAGFAYQVDGLKTVFYLRPALNLDTRSITGEARYILSDLRNDPFSPRKILTLLGNLEALREAVLFKSRAGFRGDYYSLLMLGEQEALVQRGVRYRPGALPELNWHVNQREHTAYQQCLEQFVAQAGGDIVAINRVPPEAWDYRTAAHHSGAARDFLAPAGSGVESLAVRDVGNIMICDGSVLRRGGVANSGLTLVALALQLADAMLAAPAA